MKKDRAHTLVQLFLVTLALSGFTFGGGYVIITLMQKKFVEEYHWIDEKEMLDLVAIAQSAPGPIAVNGAIVVGYKLAGLVGVVVAVIATVLPPLVIISLISVFYTAFKSHEGISLMLKGMQAGVGAVIASVVYDMGAGVIKEKDVISIFILLVAFVANFVFSVNVVYMILLCGIFGALRTLWEGRKKA